MNEDEPVWMWEGKTVNFGLPYGDPTQINALVREVLEAREAEANRPLPPTVWEHILAEN